MEDLPVVSVGSLKCVSVCSAGRHAGQREKSAHALPESHARSVGLLHFEFVQFHAHHCCALYCMPVSTFPTLIRAFLHPRAVLADKDDRIHAD